MGSNLFIDFQKNSPIFNLPPKAVSHFLYLLLSKRLFQLEYCSQNVPNTNVVN